MRSSAGFRYSAGVSTWHIYRRYRGITTQLKKMFVGCGRPSNSCGRPSILAAMGPGYLMGPAGGCLYAQVQFEGLRSGWDEVSGGIRVPSESRAQRICVRGCVSTNETP